MLSGSGFRKFFLSFISVVGFFIFMFVNPEYSMTIVPAILASLGLFFGANVGEKIAERKKE